jgi:hypothetical protein
MLRGDVSLATAALEAVRRANGSLLRRRERRQLAQLNRQPARLTPEFARRPRAELLAHFRSRTSPKFFPGFSDLATTAKLQQQLFPVATEKLMADAQRIATSHCWPLLGFGEKCFGGEEIDWNRDPLSGVDWPLDYHADVKLFRGDGSDARVLWEVNRLAHLITLGRAYAVLSEARPSGRATSAEAEVFATEFLSQIRSWRRQNPVAVGANWACAMEVALRSINLLAAFVLFLPSAQIDEDALAELLMIFEQHGAHIRRNLEYSHIVTSNHYMCDVAGLLWLGIMLPELTGAGAWREFGLRELLKETDQQTLPDGADWESSTGYHRLKFELILYSFVLCRENGIEIDQKYWQKLRSMADYTRAYLRPDGRAPLIGDSDSGQILPIVKRAGDDHAYVLDVVAGTQASGMQEHAGRDKGTHASGMQHARGVRTGSLTEELLWILGEPGVRDYECSPTAPPAQSQGFPDAGVYILRQDDLYLLFNASGCGLNGRGSHGHNDALSVEVSACGTAFIVDPGSYVYTHDLRERHLFRSTAYHSTVQIDGLEQNTTDEQAPFVIGDEAHPRVLKWETNRQSDYVAAEHNGYARLNPPVRHQRSIRFAKPRKYWLITDSFAGKGSHDLASRFHCAPGLDVDLTADGMLRLYDKISGARLFIAPLTENGELKLERGFASRDYGNKQPSLIACWSDRADLPLVQSWAIIPLRIDGDEASAAALIAELRGSALTSDR